MQNVVIFHANCADGFCAAWVARNVLPSDTIFHPVNYGDPVPEFPSGCRVWILDFSYPKEQLLTIAERSEHTRVIDHHKSAKEELLDSHWAGSARLSIVFRMDKSGGRLAWEEFHSKEKSPWLVDYTEDRDLWLWKLPQSREINAALASYPRDFGVWDNFAAITNVHHSGLEAEGKAILRYQAQVVESQCKNAVEIDMDGYKVLSVNATVLISEIAGKLAESRPFGVTYFTDAKGRRIWSLRSREGGVDVSEIAKRHGGGGHRQAAGYEEG
jgi:oligoribonuclease NrnB/cAMP/cGMP phosphodiesterase (DHH superfamily)